MAPPARTSAAPGPSSSPRPALLSSTRGEAEAGGISDEIQLVSFELSGQEYALPIEHVQEIVQVPEIVSALPNAPHHAIGVITLRERLLPLVKPAPPFGLAEAGLSGTEPHRRGVLERCRHRVRGDRDGYGQGECWRVARGIVTRCPICCPRRGAYARSKAICRIDQGRRLVSILSAERLFDTAIVCDERPGRHGEDDAGHARCGRDAAGRRGGAIRGLSASRTKNTECRSTPCTRSSACPSNSPACRGRRASSRASSTCGARCCRWWISAAASSCRIPSANDRQRIMVFMIENVRTGFIVDSVSEVLKIPRSAIAPAPDLSQDEGSAIERNANLAEAKRIILMLNVDRLLNRREVADLRRAA